MIFYLQDEPNVSVTRGSVSQLPCNSDQVALPFSAELLYWHMLSVLILT